MKTQAWLGGTGTAGAKGLGEVYLCQKNEGNFR